MDFEQKNLVYLKEHNPELFHAAQNTPVRQYALFPSKKGSLTLTFRSNGEDFFFHSRFNPEEEALKLVQKADLKADHFLVLGLGAGYHLAALMAQKPPDSRVLLLEPDFEVFILSLKTIDWRRLLNRNDFLFCFGRNINVLASAVQAFVDVGTFYKLEKIELSPALRFHGDFFKSAYDIVDKEVKTIFYDFKTRLAEDSMTPRNILKNSAALLRTRPVRHLRNAFVGAPGFIVSAGPSLDKNVLQLKKIRDRGVIICVDTALKPLLKKNIQPHFTISADPSYKNYLHLQGTQNQMRHFLVTDTSISSPIYQDFRDNLFSVSLGKPLIRLMEQAIGQIGELDAWGSVISLAFHFAVYTGLDPIVFLGQDFAFTDMRNHCRGTCWEDAWQENLRELDLIQRQERGSMDSISNVREMNDIFGHPINSSDKLLLYKNYLAKALTSLKTPRFINATEGGVLGEIENLPLRQVIREHIVRRAKIDFQRWRSSPHMDSPDARRRLLALYEEKATFFRKYSLRVKDFIQRLEKADNASLHQLGIMLAEADKLKTGLYKIPENGELLEMWSQGPIYEFLRRWAPLKHQPLANENRNLFLEMFLEYFKKIAPLANNVSEAFETGIAALNAADAPS